MGGVLKEDVADGAIDDVVNGWGLSKRPNSQCSGPAEHGEVHTWRVTFASSREGRSL